MIAGGWSRAEEGFRDAGVRGRGAWPLRPSVARLSPITHRSLAASSGLASWEELQARPVPDPAGGGAAGPDADAIEGVECSSAAMRYVTGRPRAVVEKKRDPHVIDAV